MKNYFHNIGYRRKMILLGVATAFLLLLAWNFAFRNTYEAMSLNGKLKEQLALQTEGGDPGSSYLSAKAGLLDSIVKGYSLDSANWSNDFWLKISAALPANVEVIYQPKVDFLAADTSQFLKKEIGFLSDYKTLVSLLDSLERIQDNGYISNVQFTSQKKSRAEGRRVRMEVNLAGIKRTAD